MVAVIPVVFSIGFGFTIMGLMINKQMRDANIFNAPIRRVILSFSVPFLVAGLVGVIDITTVRSHLSAVPLLFFGMLASAICIGQLFLYLRQENRCRSNHDAFQRNVDCKVRNFAQASAIFFCIVGIILILLAHQPAALDFLHESRFASLATF